jgi:hypothetical protein
VSTSCFPDNFFLDNVGIVNNNCYFRNEDANPHSYTAASRCCRVPGK